MGSKFSAGAISWEHCAMCSVQMNKFVFASLGGGGGGGGEVLFWGWGGVCLGWGLFLSLSLFPPFLESIQVRSRSM